ncbi:hypothetical protein BCR37DRAFT_382185 [Protomyces lactucae-debilis]|uniref:Nitrite reductase [NAD(P)H] n=1 Tax=Protomyces lactucae-debilis TaxID=2754530 RepID=A0A1Y2F4Y4_PROLT|nr:uncharacterized protein BCR37DRAFT_382185 [Protomyces lactucae-debilis]ORY78544.1 hypothetical protein BCR37DRAFT_382185 [Protomyces lactucae-debilis]
MAPLVGREYAAETPATEFQVAQSMVEGERPSTPPETRPVSPTDPQKRTRIVVVGLGMVGISFIEKLLERDAKQKQYSVIVLGEEKHVAYNRVGLTSFFEHRSIPDLYLNPEDWYTQLDTQTFTYKTSSPVTAIDRSAKKVITNDGAYPYDLCVMATGSEAVRPKQTPNYDAKGVFVYRTIGDLEEMIEYAETVSVAEGKQKKAIVVGGGLLGLEAAHAVKDMKKFDHMTVVHRSKWLLSQQLDQQGGDLLTAKVREMGVEVLLEKQIQRINVDNEGAVVSVTYLSGETEDCQLICFAIGIRARDNLAVDCGLDTHSRGGVVVDDDLCSSDKNIYAVGECGNWKGNTFGLIGPGIEMADIVTWNLTQAKLHAPRAFTTPDLSTKLKLMGVDVGSFGDFFADRDGPRSIPKTRKPKSGFTADDVRVLKYHDPFEGIYKKLIFSKDGKYLLGGILVGNTSEFVKLNSIVKGGKELAKPPSEFVLGAKASGEDDGADLDDDAQVCSCHNVTKGDIAEKVSSGTCSSMGEIKSCTKAVTGCGGCEPLVKAIFTSEMKKLGNEISNNICPHFNYSRADLFNVVRVKKLESFDAIMRAYGKRPDALGCEICKPCIASILSSLFNPLIRNHEVNHLQDTNDRFLANIQRNGTFSVVPRMSAGEVTPARLIVLGQVAKKYNLYTKITGGQRIDLFGAQRHDLPDIWEELVNAGFESGHAYGKSLRTVKSCVGSSWCRYGIGDSVGLAVRLEERYKSIRSPHKFKGGISGCVRECAEAQGKDFGCIATDKGFNVYVCGNGGASPKHAELLQADVLPDQVVPLLDRFIMFYIRTADRLQRTARWLEQMEGGIEYLRQVIISDKLGICEELEAQMQELVGKFECEWTAVVQDPAKRAEFKQFVNTDKTAPSNVEQIQERGQVRPANWPKKSDTTDFKNTKWSSLSWEPVCSVEALKSTPAGASATVLRGETQLAIFHVQGKGYFASQAMCPHRKAFVLAQGLIGDDENGEVHVSCPMHKRNYVLDSQDHTRLGGCKNDEDVSVATFPCEVRDNEIYLKLPPVAELDEVLGTSKHLIKQADHQDEGMKALDRRFKTFGSMAKVLPEPVLSW